MYLGDGHIVRVRNTYKLSISCDQRYPGIIDAARAAIDRIVPNKIAEVRSPGCVNVYVYSCHWPCFFPQHGPGHKHERPIILESWQREIVQQHPRPFLRGLIHSDGCRVQNVAVRTTELAVERRYYTRYQFSNRSEDILKLFTDACDLIGVRWTRTNGWTVSVSRRKDVHHLDSFIGPKR